MSEEVQTESDILVVGVCGSLRPGSHTRMALHLALEGAQEVGARTRLIELNDYGLVFCDGRDDEGTYPEGVARLCRELQEAQGIILGTPEYHGGFSGVLKNALDLTGFAEFEGKMLGLIGVSGGSGGAAHALNNLRTIGRSLHAWVVPEQASIPGAEGGFDEGGNLKRRSLAKRVKNVGRQVARFSYLHSSEQVQEFLRLWEEAPANPGGGDLEE